MEGFLSVVGKNIISNILGKSFSAILSLVFIPYYVRLLGTEAYGLIGIYATLLSVFMVADLGLSGAFTREIARLSVLEENAQQIHNLGRTFEGIFFFLGFIIAIGIAGSSRLLSEHWVNAETLSISTVALSIVLIGIVVGLQFPLFIYHGGLQGLQRQMILNVLLVIVGILKGFGSVFILVFVEQSIQAFFVWQVVISVLQLVAARILMWRSFTNVSVRSRFDLKLIRPLWRFAAGMTGITLSGILLTQVDKLMLVKMLPLEKFGYYALAWVVASVPGMIAMPIYIAFYPRFIQLVANSSFSELTVLYHRACQLLSVILVPLGLLLVFFSKEMMLIWTRNAVTVNNTYLFVSILAFGSTIMSLMLIPYALQLAFGWTMLNLLLNIVCTIILIPALVWLVSDYGALGACFVWVALCLIQFTVLIHFMHRRILKEEKWKWYINDIGKPLLPSLIIMFICRCLVSETMTIPCIIASISLIFIISVFTSALTAPYVRNIFLAKILLIQRHQ